ncbi:MAG: RtcB family protein, partial [Candidatus Pacebacteria bacterium]|nr:RtcB family protein [Candidatus Paceibacterota bacterium]
EKTELKLLYDVAHNIAKIEEHEVEDQKTKLIVHRKGATRAFPPGHPEVPEKYRSVGQPVLLPGTMGTSSYVLSGTKHGKGTFFSVAHGAGRAMSRRAAMKRISGQEVMNSLKLKEIIVRCQSIRGIAEEAPIAYKNIDDIINVVEQAGLSKKVAKLVPLVVIKGE